MDSETTADANGPITFLFTDIEKSTQLWERYGEQMRPALARHDALLRTAVEQRGGRIVKTTGDGLLAVFESAAAALAAVLAAQRGLSAESWPWIAPDALRVRMGLHSGAAELRAGDYFGTAVNRAARIMDLGHGGQVLFSAAFAAEGSAALPPRASLRDMGAHPLRGLRGEERIYQLVVPDLVGDFPPLRSSRLLAGNLPAHVSSFVGRTREMTEVRAALPKTRLLTLTGPGGTGKTRLSLQVALDVQAEYEHGAWIVELARFSDPVLVPAATATVFGLSGQTAEQTQQILFDYLREKELLLVLDNCEHLIEACARLASDLIATCPRLTILASSREGLGIYGEMTYHLPTLSLPGTNGATAQSAGQSEAVQLFIERAAAVQPGFKLSDGNALAISQIVKRLDGIPLAIELAAARLSVFSVEQVAARLDDRFRLLTGGSRTALPRQQTLRALIDWSYDLLDDEERALFRKLSVFSNGWTFEAAESVGAPLDSYALLPQLVSKSLVTREPTPAPDTGLDYAFLPEPRYTYLETIRQYALDRLLESGEFEEARDNHFAYYEGLAASVDFGAGPGAAMALGPRFPPEFDNLRAAVKWGSNRYPEQVLDLLWNFAFFLSDQLPGAEFTDWIAFALQQLEAWPPEEGENAEERKTARNKGLVTLSLGNMFLGRFDEASRYAVDVSEMLHEIDDRTLAAVAAYVRAQSAFFLQEPDLERLAAESLSRLDALDYKPQEELLLPFALVLSAEIASSHGDEETVEHHIQEIYNRVDTLNSYPPWIEYFLLRLMTRSSRPPADLPKQYEKTVKALRLSRSRIVAGMAESDWAHYLHRAGDLDEALAIYRRMLDEWRKLGNYGAMANILENIAFVVRKQGKPSRAATLLGAAERIREEIGQDMLKPERRMYEREVIEISKALLPEDLQSNWERGRGLSNDAVIALAMEGELGSDRGELDDNQ